MAVVRRTKQELNVDIQEEKLIPCGKFQYFAQFDEVAEHEIDNVFLYLVEEGEMENLVGNPEEVAKLQWVEKGELDQWLAQEPEAFSAWFKRAYQFVCEKMKEL